MEGWERGQKRGFGAKGAHNAWRNGKDGKDVRMQRPPAVELHELANIRASAAGGRS